MGICGGDPPIACDCLPAALASRDANPQAARGLVGTAAPGSGGFGCAGWAAPPGGGSGSSARPPSRHAPLLAATGSTGTWLWGTAGSRRTPELQLRWASMHGGWRVEGGEKALCGLPGHCFVLPGGNGVASKLGTKLERPCQPSLGAAGGPRKGERVRSWWV